MNIIYAVVGLCVLWSIWGLASSRVPKTPYSVLEAKHGYEVRLYPAHIVAQTTVKGSYDMALNQGFRIVAGYIFGGNTRKESISMTSPVVESSAAQNSSSSASKRATSESIAMTSPVVATIEGESHTIAFGMPQSYTLETLPTPTDSRVTIATIPEKKMAVIRFSWMRTPDRVQSHKQSLLDALAKDNITVVGSPEYAGYNAPWTPPWMTRHEVLVEIK